MLPLGMKNGYMSKLVCCQRFAGRMADRALQKGTGVVSLHSLQFSLLFSSERSIGVYCLL